MIVGIDLGTTNSAIAVWREGQSQLIPNLHGDMLTPSAVSIGDDGSVLIGLAARDRQSTHPKHTATSFKRMMGTRQTVTLGKTKFSPEDLSAIILKSLKQDAERYLGAPVTEAVITVPAYFNDKQRRATRTAGELAGLKVARLVNEPTAAALAYGIHQRDDHLPFLIFDLGGGTFDVSVVEKFDGIIEVRASAGDNRLGGDDFNACVAALGEGLLPDLNAMPPDKRQALHHIIVAAAERTRRQLTDHDEAVLTFIWDGQRHERLLTSEDFEQAVAPLIERLRTPVLRALRDGNIRSSMLGEVVLVGGSTRMPIVRKTVTRMFGRFPNTGLDPDQAIALGAAVQAGLLQKGEGLEEVRLTDVCPYTLGVGVSERDRSGYLRHGVFSPIIERNVVIPASRVQQYQTMSDNQVVLEFPIFQGESRDTSNNISLGSVRVAVPPAKAGEIYVDCRFSYDTSGLLEVDITVPSTGVTQQAVILDGDNDVSSGELEHRRKALAKLKVHPRDEAINSATLARAHRCYEQLIGDERDHVGRMITAFEASLAGQNPRDIEEARKAFEAALDTIEGARYL